MTYLWDDNSRKRVLGRILQHFHHHNIINTGIFTQSLIRVLNSYIENAGTLPDTVVILQAINSIRTNLFNLNRHLKKKALASTISGFFRDEDETMVVKALALIPNTVCEVVRIYIDDVDSFKKVKTVSSNQVSSLVPLNVRETKIKQAIADILGEPFVSQDWGGETADLYSTYVIYEGNRLATGFLLKGPGVQTHTLKIKHLGKNGDQIIRLTKATLDLYVVQFVGQVDQAVVDHLVDSVSTASRKAGRNLYYCIIDGTDTARLLKAYQKLD